MKSLALRIKTSDKVSVSRNEVTQSRKAFSLVEVVVALGIFAIAIVSVIGLLSPTVKSVNDVVDDGIAQRLAGNVNLELQRYGMTAIATALPNANARLYLMATRDGSRVLVSGENPANDSGSTTAGRPAENDLSAGVSLLRRKPERRKAFSERVLSG